MKLIKEKTPYDFLTNDCWEVDGLVDTIRDNGLEDAFNDLMEEIFPNPTDFISFQDYCRFNSDEIARLLGVSDEEGTEE